MLWVVYAKQLLDGRVQVLEYLGRYAHRVAISNERHSRHGWKQHALLGARLGQWQPQEGDALETKVGDLLVYAT